MTYFILLAFGLFFIPTSQASADCDLCITVVGAVEDFVLAGDTIDEIVNKTQQFCTTLGALQPLCESMIERYLPEIIENIIENNLDPFAICKILKICTDDDTTPSIPTTTPGPGPWVYVETFLEGERVLTVQPDGRHVWMSHKQGKDKQMWRLEHDGCLRNKAHMDRCLGLETHTTGGGVVLQPEQGIDSQRWKYENKYIENLAKSNTIWVANHLSLNVIWANVPLVTDGAGVNVKKQDDSLSMHWSFTKPCHIFC